MPLALPLRSGGARVHVVLPGGAFRTDGPGCYTADPGAPGDLARVLAHIGRPVHGVLHLWALGASTTAWTARARDLVCGSVPPLVAALDAVNKMRAIAKVTQTGIYHPLPE